MVHAQRPAMATQFEAWLVGDDDEHLRAVVSLLFDEVARIDRLLSRFDPAAEVRRVNSSAAMHGVLVDVELFSVLQDCAARHDDTDGYFSVFRTRRNDDVARHGRRSAAEADLAQAVELNQAERRVTFLTEDVELDLGGYGKGYALDVAANVLAVYGVRSAVVHGGTSSILVRGARENGCPWQIDLGDPFADAPSASVATLQLTDCGVSTSVVSEAGEDDLFDPHARKALSQPAACTVLAATALDAEVYSTAFLAMGKNRAHAFLRQEADSSPPRLSVAWYEPRRGQTTVDWLTGSPHDFGPR